MRTFWVNGLNKMGLESGTYVLASEAEAEIAALRAEIDDYHDRLTAAAERERVLREALNKIANTISYLQDNLKDDERLDGNMAIALSNDPGWLKDIARAALAQVKGS